MSLPQTYKALRSQGKGSQPKIEELPLPKPPKNEVLVKMEFVPVNATDLIIINYDSSTPSPIGMEGSGTIVALGEDLKVPHQVGDKVYVVALEPDGTGRWGTYGQYLTVSSEVCSKIQEGVTLEEAASNFINPGTVNYMGVLAERGGHKAVIHSVGSSHLGKMLIKYFKHKGIKTINIVRKDEYIEELKKEGADYVLNSQAPDFEAQLKEVAGKENATLSFDAIGGKFTGLLVRNQPANSVCYVYGRLGDDTVGDISISDLLFQRKKVLGFTVFEYMNERNEKGDLQEYFKEVHSLIPTLFKPVIHKVFKWEDLNEAVEYYKQNSAKGKILLKFD